MLKADCYIQSISNEGEYVRVVVNVTKKQSNNDGRDITLGKAVLCDVGIFE